MAIHPGSTVPQGGSRSGDTAKLRLPRGRRRRPAVALLFALLGLLGLAATGFVISKQIRPRQFTAAQKQQIEAWEVAKLWRTTPKTELFPAVVGYHLGGAAFGAGGGLRLRARRLEIGQQASCGKAVGASQSLRTKFQADGCQAVLRATYSDASGSLVLTVGIAVLKNASSAKAVAEYLTHRAESRQGAISRKLVLHPLQVSGTPAAVFGTRQRQLSWVAGSGPYVVMATVGYADGRPRVSVTSDEYIYLEMTSLARGVVAAVASPLAVRPPVPHCPGALSAC